jgi:hypothetical protein
MAVPVCQQAERECPRTGPGRKPEIPDWVMAVLIMVGVLKKRKSKSAQYRFLREHRRLLMTWLGVDRFPARSTYFDRYRRGYRLFEAAVRVEGKRAVQHGLTGAETVAVDQSVVKARGPQWNKRQRARGRVPPGCDLEATWTYSKYHGWILGYSYEVVVTAEKSGTVWPLLASADPACWQAGRTFPPKIEQLPQSTRHVLADAGYDSNCHGEAIEWDAKGRRTGRHFLCPQIYRRGEHRRPAKPKTERGSRRIRRQRRDERRCYLDTRKGRRLYARRSQTVEPFNSWLKSLFDLHLHAWHRGLDNNRTQLLAAIFAYQMLLRYNRQHGNRNGQLQWILDIL